MGWIAAEAYERAEVDPLADIAASILDHMNADHADALALLARQDGQGQADSACMTAVDRWGFHLRTESKGEAQEQRVSFPQEVRNATEARQVFAHMTQQARAAQT
jgi:putative heme iron utilization protein